MSFFRLLTCVWYEPDSNALDLLDGFDPVWRGIFAGLLADAPANRSLTPLPHAVRRRRAWVLAAIAAALAAAVAAWFLIGRSGGAKSPCDDRNVEDLFFFPK